MYLIGRGQRGIRPKLGAYWDREQLVFPVAGRVVALKVEADGDLHIALQDATEDKPGIYPPLRPLTSAVWSSNYAIGLPG